MHLMFKLFPVLFAGGLALTPAIHAAPTPASTPAPPIALSELQQRGVLGQLQVKLGTIVTVQGHAVANRRPTKASSGIPFFLRVERVDGRRLQTPVSYSFAHRTIKAPTVGAAFRYVAYETGEFVGSPPGEFKHVPAYTTTGYHFLSRLVILAARP